MTFDHVSIVVKNTKVSADFYQQVLGAEVVGTHSDERLKLTLLQAGGQGLELLEYQGQDYVDRERGPVDHIAFRVDNLEQALEKAKAAGAPLLFPEPRQVGDKKIMFFSGPDGERVEFIEML